MRFRSWTRALAPLAIASGATFAACGDTADENPAAGNPDAATTSDGASDSTVGDGGTSDGTALGDGASGSDAAAEAAACNADLTTDKNHCGACFHDCSGGTCAGGICTLMNGTTPKTRAGLSQIAVSGDRVFFGVSTGDDGIHSCATSGCVTASSTRITVANTETSPWGITVHQGFVYWTEFFQATGGAYRTPVDGGASVRVSTGDTFKFSTSVVASDSGIWWTNDDDGERVGYCPLGLCAGAATKLPNPDGGPAAAKGFATALAQASDGSILWFENGILARCTSPTCATGVSVLADAEGPVEAMVVNGSTAVYGANFHDQIRSCPLTGCGAGTTVLGGQTYITAMALRGTWLYWAIGGTAPAGGGATTDGIIRKCDLANCAGTVVDIATGQAAPQGIAVDDTSVYWSNMGRLHEIGTPGSVKKAPL